MEQSRRMVNRMYVDMNYLYAHSDIVNVIKASRVRWLGYDSQMEEQSVS